jgi:hypothetical protein
MHVTVSAAFGRKYKNKPEILADWLEGKDFRIRSVNVRGTYVNIRDANNAGLTSLTVRYNMDRDFVMLEKKGSEWK